MSDQDNDSTSVQKNVVTCPNCGQRNRVFLLHERFGFRCGACKTDLPKPLAGHEASGSEHQVKVESQSKVDPNRFVWWGLGTIVFLWLLQNFINPTDPNSQKRSTSNQNPERGILRDLARPAISLPPPRQLPNGTIRVRGLIAGNGELSVDNGTDRDAVVKVVDEHRRAIISEFYVQTGSKASVPQIPVGNYAVIFALGNDWDEERKSFTRDKSFGRYDEPLSFSTERSVEGNQLFTRYSVFTLTLHKVIGGNAKTSNLTEEEFNRY